MEPFVGEIRAFAFNQIPRNWMSCNGALLPIQQNQALFALLGTRYGGNGSTNFALPDLRGRAPLGAGGAFPLASADGSETVTLNQNQIPQHTHQVACSSAVATTNVPTNAVMAEAANSLAAYGTPTNAFLAPAAVATSGDNLPHENMQPSLVVNWCIATQGIFPPRS
ncbi:Phage Tail Collar Domain [Delftia tsuruhatensis]|uniref:phage tail protein n=1 Tax=Delftia tsuruhatensis TaxID=180282 RepID=UPI001E8098F1|nr:tail fiber protein [Delftia tsuruhatensis]CAB5690450.1 Phage Tail Collar Domain [Delftia tsuruhatensis]CAC9677026.1 Phage Tail Collar Domain [Delftia tsuruhatensis]